MRFDPEQIYAELREHDIEASLLTAGQLEEEEAAIELNDGLLVLLNGSIKLVQNVEGTHHTRGKYTDVTEMIDWIKAYQALNR